MIVCHCNVLTEAQILSAIRDEAAAWARSPVQIYRCLGCAPNCGRCLATVRDLLAQAHGADCDVGCPACPASATPASNDREPAPHRRIAAE